MSGPDPWATQHGRDDVGGAERAPPDDVRLGSHVCPNGHRVEPSVATIGTEIVCPVCGATFEHPGAESFAFNSYGACPACEGLGVRSEVNVEALVPDQDKTIEEGAVLPWNGGGRRLSMYAAGEQGVRLNVPFRTLTTNERDIVFYGPPVQRKVTLTSGRTGRTVQLTVNYDNAVTAVERSLRSENGHAPNDAAHTTTRAHDNARTRRRRTRQRARDNSPSGSRTRASARSAAARGCAGGAGLPAWGSQHR